MYSDILVKHTLYTKLTYQITKMIIERNKIQNVIARSF